MILLFFNSATSLVAELASFGLLIVAVQGCWKGALCPRPYGTVQSTNTYIRDKNTFSSFFQRCLLLSLKHLVNHFLQTAGATTFASRQQTLFFKKHVGSLVLLVGSDSSDRLSLIHCPAHMLPPPAARYVETWMFAKPSCSAKCTHLIYFYYRRKDCIFFITL